MAKIALVLVFSLALLLLSQSVIGQAPSGAPAAAGGVGPLSDSITLTSGSGSAGAAGPAGAEGPAGAAAAEGPAGAAAAAGPAGAAAAAGSQPASSPPA